MQYIASQVKERAQNGCVACTDEEVYGLAMHYFEEDSIKVHTEIEASVCSPVSKPTAYEKKTEKAKKEAAKQENGQMSMFDMLGI